MIVGNRIIFGFGTIGVMGSSLREQISFTVIKPPQEIGENIVDESIEIGETIILKEDRPYEFYNLVKTVNESNRVIEYKGHVLDFTTYNQKSVNVVLKHARNMVNLRIYAC